ncbi:MAG: hypothetical protein GY820_02855 [Gammaproteobacteria bacterium]|nr:hypothetical protein [Gammaproteobacteria bacterium]
MYRKESSDGCVGAIPYTFPTQVSPNFGIGNRNRNLSQLEVSAVACYVLLYIVDENTEMRGGVSTVSVIKLFRECNQNTWE